MVKHCPICKNEMRIIDPEKRIYLCDSCGETINPIEDKRDDSQRVESERLENDSMVQYEDCDETKDLESSYEDFEKWIEDQMSKKKRERRSNEWEKKETRKENNI